MDENRAIAGQNAVTGTPTLFLYKGGRLIDRVVGALPRTDLQRHLDSLLTA